MLKISPATLLLILLLGGLGMGWWISQRPASKAPDGPEPEDLRKQVTLLEGQVEYLQGQVGALQEENTQLIQKLGTLGMKGVAKMDAAPVLANDEPPDFVGMGLDMMKFRKLQALPIPTMGTSAAEVERVILQWLRKQQPGDEAPRFGLALTALGWIEQPVDPLPLRAAVLARQIGGWYDPESSTLLVSDDKPAQGMPAPDRPLAIAFGQLLREYGSTLFPSDSKQMLTTDERIAREALIAGDAGLTRFLFSIQNPIPQSPNDLPADDPDHPINQVPMPVYLKELAMFPFSRGFEFSQSLHSAGDYAQMNAAYSRPPTSCAEVIEPERFLDATRLPPAPVTLSSTEIEKTQPYWDDRLGRFATFVALRTYNSEEEAGKAARGWKGDRLLAYAAPDAPRDHAAWQTLWLTEADAVAFFKAMRSCLSQRYDASLNTDTLGQVTLEAQGRHVRLITNRDGLGVLLIDAATPAFAEALTRL
ncbi:MAG: hypothetical protein ABL974_08135 [Prosthecobacter sp.]